MARLSAGMVLKAVSVGLKIFALVTLIVATGLMTFFVNKIHDDLKKDDPKIDPFDFGAFGRFEFFLYTTTVGILVAIFGMVAVLARLYEKDGGIVSIVVINALWTLQLLVSSVLLFKVLDAYHYKEEEDRTNIFNTASKSRCESLDEDNKQYHCNQIAGGVAMGFIATVLFAVDTVISFFLKKFSKQEGP